MVDIFNLLLHIRWITEFIFMSLSLVCGEFCEVAEGVFKGNVMSYTHSTHYTFFLVLY